MTEREYEGITMTGHQPLAVNLKLSSEDPVNVNAAEYDKEHCIFTSADG